MDGAQGRPRASEFVFARLRYDSGDWDYNPKVAANVLNSVVEYTNIRVYPEEVVIAASSTELLSFPFLFMTGHKLVRFTREERERLRRSLNPAACCFPTTAITTSTVSTPAASSSEMRTVFPRAGAMPKLPRHHHLYKAFFRFDDGPPTTSHELNGWGDEIVHDYLRGVERNGRLGVLYSNKDYGCEWDYDWRNKRFQRQDNTKFAVNIVVYAMT